MKSLEIVKACAAAGIGVQIWKCDESPYGIQFVVEGFAKSGNARLVEDANGIIVAHLRYQSTNFVESFEDLRDICWDWCTSYEDYGYGCWTQAFIEANWLTEVSETKTKLVRK